MGIALLLRHGRSTANVDGILAGRLPGYGLHASGVEQAQALAVAFAGTSLASVHVSPLQRTRETADIVLPDTAAAFAEELLECDYGQWSGRPLEELAREPLWEQLHERPSATVFPGGEGIADVASRVVAYVRAHASTPGLHLFVTHADPIMMLAAHAVGTSLDHYQQLHVEPCSLTTLLVQGDAMGVLSVNVPPSGAAETLASLQRWVAASAESE